MLSRRNIRIKVMQVLYAMTRDQSLTPTAGIGRYNSYIRKSYELYLFNVAYLAEVAEYAKKDAENRSAKYRPTAEDENFNAVLATNVCSDTLISSDPFRKEATKYAVSARIDGDTVRKLYTEFSKTDLYQSYCQKEDFAEEEHREVLLQLYRSFSGGEFYNDLMEDHFANWLDDKSLVVGSLKKTIKALPSDENFFEQFRPTDDTVKEFGEELLKIVLNEDATLLGYIEPALKNWDADRVALIDMILLKMAIAEFLYFPTIPTKVTLNEFVEVAKLYSTEKSKDFVNGILDRLLKQLKDDGKIRKLGRGLVD